MTWVVQDDVRERFEKDSSIEWPIRVFSGPFPFKSLAPRTVVRPERQDCQSFTVSQSIRFKVRD